MIGRDLVEHLSRDLDDDLSDAERNELRAAIAPGQLEEERLALAEVRLAVRRLAEDDEPPRRLDLVLEPLVRAGGRPGWWTAGGWLAAAASAIATAVAALWLAAAPPADPTGARDGSPPPVDRATPASGSGREGRSELHAALRRGELPAIPDPEAPPPLEVIGPLPFPPELFDGRPATLVMEGAGTIRVRVPRGCGAGAYAVVVERTHGGLGELRVTGQGPRGAAGCFPIVALEAVPDGFDSAPARLEVAAAGSG